MDTQKPEEQRRGTMMDSNNLGEQYVEGGAVKAEQEPGNVSEAKNQNSPNGESQHNRDHVKSFQK
jgi:hypothetical protein